LIEPLNEPGSEGWFPKGEVSLIGGPSGAGKTSLMIPLLGKVVNGEDVFGHKTKPREYGILLHDRSKKALSRTAKALGLSSDVLSRVIRLTPEQQRQSPAEILESAIEGRPDAEAWFIEGLDLWMPKITDLEAVAGVMDGLQRVAIKYNVAVLGSVGSPKQAKGEGYSQHRDRLIGSTALGRKAETIVLIELHDPEDANSVRRCTVLCRCGRAENFFFEMQAGRGLVLTAEPEAVSESTALSRMEAQVFAKFKPGEMVVWSLELGPKSAFYRWRKDAGEKLAFSNGCYFIPLTS
jgi:hypothetical protein